MKKEKKLSANEEEYRAKWRKYFVSLDTLDDLTFNKIDCLEKGFTNTFNVHPLYETTIEQTHPVDLIEPEEEVFNAYKAFSELLKILLSLSPVERDIVSIKITNPDISNKEIAKTLNYSESYISIKSKEVYESCPKLWKFVIFMRGINYNPPN